MHVFLPSVDAELGDASRSASSSSLCFFDPSYLTFNFILCQLFPHLNHVFIFTLRFSLYLCCTVISTEPYIITGHLGAAGRDEPAARQMTKCTVGGHTLMCMHPHTLLSHTLNSYKSSQGSSLPSDIARPYSRTYTPFKQSTAV